MRPFAGSSRGRLSGSQNPRQKAAELRQAAQMPRAVVPAWKIWAALCLLVAALVLAYANSLHGPFIFDDEPSIVDNPSIRHLGSPLVLAAPPTAVTTVGRPLVNLSFALNYAVAGLQVEGYHGVNLALHILAALALFALVRRTLLLPTMAARRVEGSTGLALAAALLWALHPVQTESVTYVVQRAEVLVGLFYFLTLYSFVRGATSGRARAWYAAAVFACALGMASKEVMVTAPLMVVLYDRTFVAGSFRESLRRRWGLWLALAANWGLLVLLYLWSQRRGGSAGFGLGVTVWQYARTQFSCIIHYLRLAFWPVPLVLDYGAPIARGAAEIVPYALAVLALGAAVVAGLILRPQCGFLGAWFFLILAPSSSIVPLATQTEAEHRMYLPLAAVAALVVLSIHQAIGRLGLQSRRALALLISAVAGVLGWGTRQRNKDYQSELAIWDDTVRNCPQNDRAYLNRGSAYWSSGQPDAALNDYEQAIALNPRNAKAFIGRGDVHSDQGRYDQALQDYDNALKLQPGLADARNGRGSILFDKGQLDAAIREFDRAIALDPAFVQAYYNRANAYDAKGDFDAAIDSYGRVIGLRPADAKAYNSRGSAYDNKGQIEAAIRDYDRAIELRPDFAEAYSNRCSAHDLRRQFDAAIIDCGKAIEARPHFAEAYNNRGNAFQGQGRYQAAIRDYDKAIELKADFTAAYQNRAVVHALVKAYDEAWADVAMVRKLGGRPTPSFIAELTKSSGRSN